MPPSPLHAAVAARDAAAVRASLAAGADPLELHPEEGCHLFFLAVEEAGVDVVAAFLDAGVDPNLTDTDNAFALSSALEAGDLAMAALLVSRGADVNHFDEHENVERTGSVMVKLAQWTPPSLVPALRFLLDHGANPDVPCTAGWTPLMLLARSGEHAAAQLLLEAGADPNRVKGQELWQMSALTLARYADDAQMEALLVQAGAREPELAGAAHAQALRIVGALQQQLPMAYGPFHTEPGAPDTLRLLEDALGRALPVALRAFWGRVGEPGWRIPFPDGLFVLRLSEVLPLLTHQRARWSGPLENPRIARRDQQDLRPVWWSPRWLPVIAGPTPQSAMLVLDLDPPRDHLRDKIIEWDPQAGPRRVAFDCFAHLLDTLEAWLAEERLSWNPMEALHDTRGSA